MSRGNAARTQSGCRTCARISLVGMVTDKTNVPASFLMPKTHLSFFGMHVYVCAHSMECIKTHKITSSTTSTTQFIPPLQANFIYIVIYYRTPSFGRTNKQYTTHIHNAHTHKFTHKCWENKRKYIEIKQQKRRGKMNFIRIGTSRLMMNKCMNVCVCNASFIFQSETIHWNHDYTSKSSNDETHNIQNKQANVC